MTTCINKSDLDLNLFKPAQPSATRYAGMSPSEVEQFAPPMDLNKIAQGVQLILEGIGEDHEARRASGNAFAVARLYQELAYGTMSIPPQKSPVPSMKAQRADSRA